MNLRELASSAIRNYSNVWGWRTNRKIIVIESDDWGSIRMPSQSVFNKFQEKGIDLRATSYNRYDALESNGDLSALFDILNGYSDRNGNPACFTANMIMANPAFDQIKASGFNTYFYEKVQDTLRHYPQRDQVFSLYLDGLQKSIFVPQFHGREHVQINRWLKALRLADPKILFAFDHRTTYSGTGDYNFMESFDWDSPQEVESQKKIIGEGLLLFYEAFGYSSKSFIAPCYTWDSAIESTLVNHGVKYIQGVNRQYIPNGGFSNYSTKQHKMGEQSNDLTFLTRNCFFEPSLVVKSDWVGYTLTSIQDAFRWNKPAVICSHRLNYIGAIDESNRKRNLQLLDSLLRQIVKKWPDVEFMSSDKLGDIILESRFKIKS